MIDWEILNSVVASAAIAVIRERIARYTLLLTDKISLPPTRPSTREVVRPHPVVGVNFTPEELNPPLPEDDETRERSIRKYVLRFSGLFDIDFNETICLLKSLVHQHIKFLPSEESLDFDAFSTVLRETTYAGSGAGGRV